MLEGNVSIFLLLFIQWQTFCLTVAKCGLEHVIFATVSQNTSLYYDAWAAVRRRIFPLACAAAAASLVAFPAWVSGAILASVVLDSFSILTIAELNARCRFRTTAVAALLNYPLFFGLVAGLTAAQYANPHTLVGFFVFTSTVRAAWLQTQRPRLKVGHRVLPAAQAPMAAQQVGAYALLRADQLILGSLAVQTHLGLTATAISAYLFLAKFPEVVSSVLSVGGAVAFPVLFSPDGSLRAGPAKRFGAIIGLAWIGLLMSAGSVYVHLWNRSAALTLMDALPFVANAALLFPVNAVTYACLVRGHLLGLLRMLAVGLLAGLFLVMWAMVTRSPQIFPWIIPSQLAVFLLVAATAPFGRKATLYRPAPLNGSVTRARPE